MSLSDWLRAFRALHEKAKKSELTGEDAEAYRAGCDELARALMAAQRLTPKPGDVPRRALRVARALQVELETPLMQARVTTVDLGVGGFSAILAKAPPAGEEVRCVMRIPGGDPVVTDVLPGEVKQQPGSVRVSFAFMRLPAEEAERIERLVFDTALSQLAS